jgi:starch phosphorylase
MAAISQDQEIPAPLLQDMASLGLDAKSIAADIRRHFNHTLGCDMHSKYSYHLYQALALSLRDRLMVMWKKTHYSYRQHDCKRAYYLSMEFLMGRALGNAMLNMGIQQAVRDALTELGVSMEEMIELEHDAGLGNGGLGRLAACFLDSCATLQYPVMGYGIRYEYGIFRQSIKNGEQVEEPERWLIRGNPWELERPEFTATVKFGGRTIRSETRSGRLAYRWVDTNDVLAVPYDTPVPGYRNGTVNTLRLWRAQAQEVFDLGQFNAGDYAGSVLEKTAAENISMLLYPNDITEMGKELRLRQQYFLVSATLQDVMRRWKSVHGDDLTEFADKSCFQLNDTHPSIAVAELMRLLIDENDMEWDAAWEITTKCVAYTNHTLLPEALERWPVRMFERLLPRLLEIIYEINAIFIAEIGRHWPGDWQRIRRMSVIEEGGEKHVRMAHLAIVGSYSVNGVADLHSRLLREDLFRDFYEIWPQKFNNKTNGVTPRRWIAWANPSLADLITETIGEGWVTDLDQLARLVPHAESKTFRARWQKVKQGNKKRLAELIAHECGVDFDTRAMFDVQVKRIHEYKRQLLNVLHVVHLYDRIKRADTANWTPRCVLFGGKAAPGYWLAKRIIKLINNVALVINGDPEVGNQLKVAFLPNYRVSVMEIIAPASDLSEQISTAGKEASGTGNMKLMMNGAVTIGTYDGANIEIQDAVGADNFFLFGLKAEEVAALRGSYHPDAIIAADEDFARVMHMLESGHFSQFEPGFFEAIVRSIRDPNDPWLTAADFRSYVDAQQRVAAAYQDELRWTRMSILNTALSGVFSTDRTIREYNREIWHLDAVAPLSDSSAK